MGVTPSRKYLSNIKLFIFRMSLIKVLWYIAKDTEKQTVMTISVT